MTKPIKPGIFCAASGGQMKLLFADIGPHVSESDVQIRIASQSESNNIEKRRDSLIRHLKIDVLQGYDIADIFLGVIKHRWSPG
jgi:hypothetical protein